MKIIGLMGDIGSGKNTVTHLIQMESDVEHDIRVVAFADSLKDIVASIHPEWNRVALEGITVEDRAWREIPDPNSWCQKSPRDELREVSDMIKSRYGSDYFVNRTLDRIEDLKNYVDMVIVTDVRYQAEIDALLSGRFEDVTLVWVDVGLDGFVSNHPSDVEWKLWVMDNQDCVIRLDNSKKDLTLLENQIIDKILVYQ